MGAHYAIKELCGKYYIEYQNDATAWNLIAVELTYDQAKAIHDFEYAQLDAMQNFLKSIIDGIKAL